MLRCTRAWRAELVLLLALGLGLAREAGGIERAQTAAGVVERTNAFRKEQGLDGLKEDAALSRAAQRFAGLMAQTGRYGHAADNRRPPERAAAQGYEYCIVSENIAYQYRSQGFDSAGALARELVEGWKRSPGLRKNMLDPAVTETGVGIAQGEAGRWLAVQMFGRPKSASMRFSVRNRSAAPVEYRVGERRYSLAPRITRTHAICRPAEVSIGDRFSAKPADGVRYTVTRSGVVTGRR
ncbi:MAG TPA: CAP domain-containing protein [Burkholderiales bacterium]